MPDPLDKPPAEPEPRGLQRLKQEGQQQHPMVVRNVDDALRLGEIFVRSGFFDDSKAVSQAVVKVLYGVELGLTPIVAMNSIEVVEGKCAPGAALTASKIEQHPLYDYVVEERTSTACTVAFYRREDRRPDGAWQLRGRVTWDTDTATRAGLMPGHPRSPWAKYPQAMLYARAITEGARAYCPDLFHGIAAYSAEELGGAGDPVEPFALSPTPPAPEPAAEPGDDGTYTGEIVDEGDGGGEPPADEAAAPPEPPVSGPPAPPAAEEPGEGDEGAQEPGEGDDAAADAAWGASGEPPAEPTPAEEAAALEAAGQQRLEAVPGPEPAAEPTMSERVAALLRDAELPEFSTEGIAVQPEGTQEAGRAATRWLSLRMVLDPIGGEPWLVTIAEQLGIDSPGWLYADGIFTALKTAVHRVAVIEQQRAAA